MTANELLRDLLGWLEAVREETVSVGWDEVKTWPEGLLEQFKAVGLLTRIADARSITCNGCEKQCAMPVHIYPHSGRQPTNLFIACDKREDTGRIRVLPEQLQQWQISRRRVAQTVASLLSLTGTLQPTKGEIHWQLGAISGRKGLRLLTLDFSSPLALKVGNHPIPLVEILFFKGDQLIINKEIVISAVNRAATANIQTNHSTSETRLAKRKQATQERRKRCQKAYLELQRKHPGMSNVWYSQQIAKMPIAEGRTPETIRRQLRL